MGEPLLRHPRPERKFASQKRSILKLVRARTLVFAAAVALAGCAVVTGLDGYEVTDDACRGGCDAGSTEATTPDANADADPNAPIAVTPASLAFGDLSCPSTETKEIT